ncbi:MAG TPA: kelch repeat-containing protein [Myxococcota bacterium]
MRRPLVLLPVSVLVSAAALTAQTRWSELKPTTRPPKRSEYDVAQAAGNRVYLFGGRAASGYLNDTWVWDGKVWRLLSPTTRPPARSGHCMTYDLL